jgi:methyl-accepting chemotaxis protein
MKEAAARVRDEALEMKQSAHSVLEEMDRLLDITSELDNGMKEMAIGAAEIRQAANSTNDLSIQASESVKGLASQTEKFKV